MLKLPDILLDLPRLLVDVFDLMVASGGCVLHAASFLLTFENPYLFNWRTNDEKFECLNVWGLWTHTHVRSAEHNTSGRRHSQNLGRELVHVPDDEAGATTAPADAASFAL